MVRTPGEILSDMNCEASAQSGLLAAYHFNQGYAGENNPAETTLADASGNGNNGTLENFALNASSSNWVAPGGVVTGAACPPCVNPDVPTLNTTSTTLCEGGSYDLSITGGDLNGATEWRWYEGTCGGSLVGTGTTLHIAPAASTSYFVRGEGGCASPGACSQVTVTFYPQLNLIATDTLFCLDNGNNIFKLGASGGVSPYDFTPGETDTVNIVRVFIISLYKMLSDVLRMLRLQLIRFLSAFFQEPAIGWAKMIRSSDRH